MTKKIIIGLVVVAAAAGGLYYYSKKKKDAAKKAAAPGEKVQKADGSSVKRGGFMSFVAGWEVPEDQGFKVNAADGGTPVPTPPPTPPDTGSGSPT